MVGILLQFVRFYRALVGVLATPQGRALTTLVIVQLTLGTIFYTLTEGWRWLDSLYFSVTTLTTVGLGDLHPTTDAGKVFTIVFVLTGVGLIVSFVTLVAQHALTARLGDASQPPDRD